MRVIGAVVAFVLVLALHSSKADTSIPVCRPGMGSVTVLLSEAKGKWLGFSGRTSSGEIVDYPPIRMSESGTLMTVIGLGTNGGQVFELGRRGRELSEVRASTWKRYNKKTRLMEERIEDTGWVACNQ